MGPFRTHRDSFKIGAMMSNSILPALGFAAISACLATGVVFAAGEEVSDAVIAEQNAALIAATQGKGYGPQAPRDLTDAAGSNDRAFGTRPMLAMATARAKAQALSIMEN